MAANSGIQRHRPRPHRHATRQRELFRHRVGSRSKKNSVGHAGQPEDVAEAVAYLSSDAAKHMTGQTIHVNGGRIMT